MNTRLQVQTKTTPKSSFIPGRTNLLPHPSTEQAETPLVPPILHDMLPAFQAKLTVSQPNDQYEQEADRLADQVMRMPEPKIQRVCPECEEELQRQPMEKDEEEEETLQTKPLASQITPLVQRQTEPMEEEEEEAETLQTKPLAEQITPSVQRQAEPLEDEEEEEETLQTKPLAEQITPLVQSQAEPMEEEEEEEEELVQRKKNIDSIKSLKQKQLKVPSVVHEVLNAPGQQLDRETRDFMESRFGHDFSQVRVHTDTKAAESSKAIHALAYTVGHNLVFSTGQYKPQTFKGRSLIAHELAHVLQQKNSGFNKQNQPIAKNWSSVPPIMRATHTFSLTFDDGPDTRKLKTNKNPTEKVLNTLRDKGIKAGFFVQLNKSQTPNGLTLLKRMFDEGHTVGIHSGGTRKGGHEYHTRAEKAGRLKGELKTAKQYIETETGKTPTLVRPTYRKHNPAVLKTYAKAKLTMMLWDIVGDDYCCKSKKDTKCQSKCTSYKHLQQKIRKGITGVAKRGWKRNTPSKNIVILYHDIRPNTAKNLGRMIEYIKTATLEITKKISDTAYKNAINAKIKADTAMTIAKDKQKKADEIKDNKKKEKAMRKAENSLDKANKLQGKANEAIEKTTAAMSQVGTADFAAP